MTECIDIDIYPSLNPQDAGVLLNNYLLKITNNKNDNILSNIDNFIKLYKDMILPKSIVKSDDKNEIYVQNINEIHKCKTCKIHYFKCKNFMHGHKKSSECNVEKHIQNKCKISNKPFLMEDFNKSINDNNCKCKAGNVKCIADNIGKYYFSAVKISYDNGLVLHFNHKNKQLFKINTELELKQNAINELSKNIYRIFGNQCFYKLSYYNVINENIYLAITKV